MESDTSYEITLTRCKEAIDENVILEHRVASRLTVFQSC